MAAPKGNKYGLGNKNAGRPIIWESAEQLQAAIDEYFTQTDIKITITGLALYLGFESRQSLYDYREREAFSFIIKKAITRVENKYEENLRENNCTGSIFALKNMGWKEKSETDINLKGGINVIMENASGCEPIRDKD